MKGAIPTLLIVFALVEQSHSIGRCREDNSCGAEPTVIGQTCKCWSTCSPFEGGRLCDHVDSGYNGYTKTDSGKNNVGCSYIPGLSNARSLCNFYYNESKIGFCREDNTCVDPPKRSGDTCECWSTCNVATDGRKCDNANPKYSGYERLREGDNDLGCTPIPGFKSARDICRWYYNDTDSELPTEIFKRSLRT